MIAIIQKLPSGNALKVLLQPTAGAVSWVVLRRDDDAFTGVDDPNAWTVYDGTDRCFVDAAGLYNGAPVWYKPYYKMPDGTWVDAVAVSAAPEATMVDLSINVMQIVRDRIELGLQVYIDRGQLSHMNGSIPVLVASPLIDQAPLPIVTVHVSNDSSAERFLGEVIGNDVFNGDDWAWQSFDGYYSRVQLTIMAWCLNADERVALRNALKALLIANLAVFEAAQMMQIDLQFSDVEDFQTYSAPIYQVVCTLSCLAPSAVSGVDPAVRDIISTLDMG